MKFLIVTPNYNSGKFIPETFMRMLVAIKGSVANHKVNWIIMDSCSTDESVANLRILISKYGYHNLRDNWNLDIRVEVKKDSGMYEGINNGMRLAEQSSIDYDCFFWLNTDDLISLNSFDSIEASMAKKPNRLSMIVGRGIDIDEDSKVTLDQPHPVIDVNALRSGNFNFTSSQWMKAESCIFPRDLVMSVGYFDERLRLAGDYDYIVRCAKIAEPFYDETCYAREFRRCIGQQSEDLKPYEIERKTLANENDYVLPDEPRADEKIGCIYFYPDYTSGNSYQSSLYAAYKNKGFRSFEELMDHCPPLSSGDVFHVHWLNDIIRRDASVATKFLDWLIAFVVRSKQAGAKIIWTIHNIHSHESKNLDIEQKAYKFLSDTCDRCHMHDPFVIYEFLEYYKYLPWGKIRIAAHGTYPFVPGPQESSITSALGLCTHEQYIVIPGQIRRYKNIPLLNKSIKYLNASYPDIQVCLLGQPHPELNRDEINSIYNHPNILFSGSRIGDDDYSRLVRDSLFALLTYDQISTSGSAIHALSQGTKVVAPRIGTLQTLITSTMHGYLYRNDDIESLRNAIDLVIDAQREEIAHVDIEKVKTADWTKMMTRILA